MKKRYDVMGLKNEILQHLYLVSAVDGFNISLSQQIRRKVGKVVQKKDGKAVQSAIKPHAAFKDRHRAECEDLPEAIGVISEPWKSEYSH